MVLKFGICTDLVKHLRDGLLNEKLSGIKSASYDYVETGVTSVFNATDEEISKIACALKAHNIICMRANGFFPGDIKLLGPELDKNKVVKYVNNVMPKLSKLGVDTVVLGSGVSRNIPNGYSYGIAKDEFCSIVRVICDISSRLNIRIALEHLNPKETNFITTIKENLACAKQVDHKYCGILFDYYHVDLTTTDMDNLKNAGTLLFHVHTATPVNRKYPFLEAKDSMNAFFEILKSVSYNGTVSIEAGMVDELSYDENLSKSYELLKENL